MILYKYRELGNWMQCNRKFQEMYSYRTNGTNQYNKCKNWWQIEIDEYGGVTDWSKWILLIDVLDNDLNIKNRIKSFHGINFIYLEIYFRFGLKYNEKWSSLNEWFSCGHWFIRRWIAVSIVLVHSAGTSDKSGICEAVQKFVNWGFTVVVCLNLSSSMILRDTPFTRPS